MPEEELGAWLRLLLTPGVGRAQARQLLAAAGSPAAVFERPQAVSQAARLGRVLPALMSPPGDWPASLQATRAWLDGGDDRFVFALGDAGYPACLLDIEDPPFCFLPPALWQGSGTRAPDGMGRSWRWWAAATPRPRGNSTRGHSPGPWLRPGCASSRAWRPVSMARRMPARWTAQARPSRWWAPGWTGFIRAAIWSWRGASSPAAPWSVSSLWALRP